ncbi:MAG: glycine/sarcosine/betaine reductase selenoprotein B family protein [Pseudomonadota bacterium]
MGQTRPPVDYIERTRDQYSALGYPPYTWVDNPENAAFVPLTKPLAVSKLGLIGSGGIYRSGQTAFHFKDDFSYREIDTTLPTDTLRATHFAYDLTAARRDPNVVFPIDTLRRCVAEGLLGALNTTAYAFMGGIYSARKVREILAPAIAQRLLDDEVDVALMVPV